MDDEHILSGIDIPVNNKIGMQGFDSRQFGAGTGSGSGWSGNLGGYHQLHPFSRTHLNPVQQRNSDWLRARNPHRVDISPPNRNDRNSSMAGCQLIDEEYHY